MMARTSLRIYGVALLISVALASYIVFVLPRLRPGPAGQSPNLCTAACMWSMYPAFRVANAVLPAKYTSMCCEDIDARDRILIPLLFATNAFFWHDGFCARNIPGASRARPKHRVRII